MKDGLRGDIQYLRDSLQRHEYSVDRQVRRKPGLGSRKPAKLSSKAAYRVPRRRRRKPLTRRNAGNGETCHNGMDCSAFCIIRHFSDGRARAAHGRSIIQPSRIAKQYFIFHFLHQGPALLQARPPSFFPPIERQTICWTQASARRQSPWTWDLSASFRLWRFRSCRLTQSPMSPSLRHQYHLHSSRQGPSPN
jgi:hypothetical protein